MVRALHYITGRLPVLIQAVCFCPSGECAPTLFKTSESKPTISNKQNTYHHLESCTPGARQYKVVRTGTCQYILFWIQGGTRKGKIVHTSTYWYVLTYDISSAKWGVHIYAEYSEYRQCSILHIDFSDCILFCILQHILLHIMVHITLHISSILHITAY